MVKMLPRCSTPRLYIKHPQHIRYASILSSNIYHVKEQPLFSSTVKNKTLYIYFKGCCSWKDYLTSIDIRTCKVNADDMAIHNGFYELYKSNEEAITSNILSNLETHDITDIVYAGHSAGGALSQLASVFLHDMINAINIKSHCYTFGTPKVGDTDFIHSLQHVTSNERYVRVEVYNDIVPLLPIHSSFVHGGQAIILANHIKDLYGTSLMSDVKGADFYMKYHRSTLEFLKDMRDHNLINTEDIASMISCHRCEYYVRGLHQASFR